MWQKVQIGHHNDLVCFLLGSRYKIGNYYIFMYIKWISWTQGWRIQNWLGHRSKCNNAELLIDSVGCKIWNYYLRTFTLHVDNIIAQLMLTNYYKIVKLLKSFKMIIVAPTCFGLHKPSSGSSQPVLRQSYNVDSGYIYRYLKLSVLWQRICSVLLCLWIMLCAKFDSTQCTIHTHMKKEQICSHNTDNFK